METIETELCSQETSVDCSRQECQLCRMAGNHCMITHGIQVPVAARLVADCYTLLCLLYFCCCCCYNTVTVPALAGVRAGMSPVPGGR